MTKLRLTNSFPHARAAAVSGHSWDAQRGFVTQSVLQHKSTLCCSTNNPFASSSAAAKLRQVHQNPRSAEVLHLSAAYWSFNLVGWWFVLATLKELCFQEFAASFASFSATDLRMWYWTEKIPRFTILWHIWTVPCQLKMSRLIYNSTLHVGKVA